jgi:hypothetical protein
MFYALLNDDGTLDRYPYSITDLRRAHPGTSWPEQVTDELAASFNVVPVAPANSNLPDDPLANHDRTAEQQNDGTWLEVWVTTPASPEEIAQRTDSQSAAIRDDRNQRLASCDWTQLSDAPVDAAEWAAYRQALRDITEQAGFPWDVQWPSAPGTVLVRARNADGQFIADDPATNTDEAWVTP